MDRWPGKLLASEFGRNPSKKKIIESLIKLYNQ